MYHTHNWGWNNETKKSEMTEITSDNPVVCKYTESVQLMSDVWGDALYAIAFDPQTRQFEKIHIATYGDCCGATDAEAVVDASDEIKALYEICKKIDELERDVNRFKQEIESLRDAAGQVDKGKIVRVVRGRKLPIGTVGKVVWIGEKVAYYARAWRGRNIPTTMIIGIGSGPTEKNGKYDRYIKGLQYTNYSNVEVIEPDKYLDHKLIREYKTRIEKNTEKVKELRQLHNLPVRFEKKSEG